MHHAVRFEGPSKMKCPQCSGSNFNWARKCDHCGHRFDGESRTPTDGAVASGGDLSAAVLDLQKHGSADIPRKTITINGATYEILARSRTIRGADVYPLRNIRTRLVAFELKVFLHAAGSQAFEDTKRRGREVFREKASMSTESDPGASYFIIEEIYEQNGGLIGIQRSLRTHPGPEYYEQRMQKAQELVNEGRLADAIHEYDRILALNPNHNAALGNKGVSLARTGDTAGAVRLFLQCIELDANDTTPYINAATFLAGSGRPEAATALLAQGLKRYSGEFATWMLLVQIATKYDTLTLVDDVVDRGMALVADSKAGQRLKPLIEESRTRWQRYCAALDQAVRVQLLTQWDEAIQLLAQAAALSKRNALAELNCCICLFHKGDLEASYQRAHACQSRLDGNHNRAAGLLLLLAAAGLQNWDVARDIAVDFHHRFTTLWDLPLVPVAAKHAHAAEVPVLPSAAAVFGVADLVEKPDVDEIVNVLATIPAKVECTAAAATALRELSERYGQRSTRPMRPTDSSSGSISDLDSGSSRPH